MSAICTYIFQVRPKAEETDANFTTAAAKDIYQHDRFNLAFQDLVGFITDNRLVGDPGICHMGLNGYTADYEQRLFPSLRFTTLEYHDFHSRHDCDQVNVPLKRFDQMTKMLAELYDLRLNPIRAIVDTLPTSADKHDFIQRAARIYDEARMHVTHPRELGNPKVWVYWNLDVDLDYVGGRSLARATKHFFSSKLLFLHCYTEFLKKGNEHTAESLPHARGDEFLVRVTGQEYLTYQQTWLTIDAKLKTTP